MKIDITINVNEEDIKKLMSYINIHQPTIINETKNIESNDDRLLSIKEVSQVLKVNQNAVYKLIKNNHIAALKLGSLKIRHIELLKFLERYNGKDFTNLNEIVDLEYQA